MAIDGKVLRKPFCLAIELSKLAAGIAARNYEHLLKPLEQML